MLTKPMQSNDVYARRMMFKSQVPELQEHEPVPAFGADVPRLMCRRSGRECWTETGAG